MGGRQNKTRMEEVVEAGRKGENARRRERRLYERRMCGRRGRRMCGRRREESVWEEGEKCGRSVCGRRERSVGGECVGGGREVWEESVWEEGEEKCERRVGGRRERRMCGRRVWEEGEENVWEECGRRERRMCGRRVWEAGEENVWEKREENVWEEEGEESESVGGPFTPELLENVVGTCRNLHRGPPQMHGNAIIHF